MKALGFGTAVAFGVAGALATSSAQAADVYSPPPVLAPHFEPAPARDWTGFHIGIDVGGQFDFTNSSVYSANQHSIYRTWQELGDEANLGAHSGFISGDVGFDVQHSNFVFGLFANYDWHPSKSTASHSAEAFADCVGCTTNQANQAVINNQNAQQTRYKEVGNTVEYGDAWGVGARAGVLVNPKTLIYGLGGYGQKHITAESFYYFDYYNGLAYNDGLSGGGWQPGWFVGGGVETRLGDSNVTLAVEYRYAQYKGFSASCLYEGNNPGACSESYVSGSSPVTNFPGPYQFNASDMEVGPTSSHTIRARLSYWFGGHQSDSVSVGY
jgi:opacity protein-like surface antigen